MKNANGTAVTLQSTVGKMKKTSEFLVGQLTVMSECNVHCTMGR